jgi:hypothetical protein
MNEEIRDEVLSSLDLINESVDQSILAVFCSVIQEYEKISVMMDNAEDDYYIYQEGQVWDTATGKGKVENGLMKLIAFIPRLFQGIFNAITSLFKKNNEADIAKNSELAKNVIASANAQQLASASGMVEKATEDNLGFDPNKKEFVLKRGLKHIRNSIYIISSFPSLFSKFITRLKGGETQYDAMVKELADVLRGKKDLDSETFYCSIDTLHELYNDGYKASMGVRGLTSELSMLLEKKMREDFENGKNVEKQASAKKLLDEISNSSKHIMNVTFGLNMLSKAIYIFGGPLYRKFKKGEITDEDIELQNDSQETREMKNKLKSLKQQYKTAKADKKNADKKREEILDLENKIKEMQEKVDNVDLSVRKAVNSKERGDVLWNQKDSTGKKRHAFADKGLLGGDKDTRSDLSRKEKKEMNKAVPKKKKNPSDFNTEDLEEILNSPEPDII